VEGFTRVLAIIDQLITVQINGLLGKRSEPERVNLLLVALGFHETS